MPEQLVPCSFVVNCSLVGICLSIQNCKEESCLLSKQHYIEFVWRVKGGK